MTSEEIRGKVNYYTGLEANLRLELRKLEQTHEELQHVKAKIEKIDGEFCDDHKRKLDLLNQFDPGTNAARCVQSGITVLFDELSNERYRTIMTKADGAKEKIAKDIDITYQAILDKEEELRSTASTLLNLHRQLQRALIAELYEAQ